jgi:multidrug resistance protein
MGKLVVLMVTAFVDMVGLLMVLPLLPFYAKALGGSGTVVGLLVSSFAIAQLVASPFWGRFSDRYGRRPALLIGLTASAIAYVVFAYASSLWLLFISRIVQGAGGGTVSVIQAYVADAVRPEDRAKGLGWLSAATNAGVALGPLLGSLAMAGGRQTPGLVAAALCFVNIIFAARYLTESRELTEAHKQPRKRGRSLEAVVRVVTHPGDAPSRLILIYAIAIGAFQGSTAILALFLAVRFGVTMETIGYFFAYIGVLSVVTRALVLGPLVDRFGEAKLSRLGLALLALGLALIAFMHPASNPLLTYLPLALVVALIPLGTAFTFPCVTSLLSRVVPSRERGLYMGVQQAFGGGARVLFPILYGYLFDRVIELPFLIAAALVAGTILLGLGMETYATHGEAKPVTP